MKKKVWRKKLPNAAIILFFLVFNSCTDKNKSVADLTNEADEFYNNNDYKKAVSAYSRLINLDSTNRNFFYKRGYSNEQLKNYSNAISDFKRCIELDPQKANAYFNTAVGYKHLGEFDSTIAYLEKDLLLDSANTRAKEILKECELFQKVEKKYNGSR